MQTDTLSYDSLDSRPLPKWLRDQKSGFNTIQPEKVVMKKDNSLKISLIATSLFIILLLACLTFYFNKKHKNQVK